MNKDVKNTNTYARMNPSKKSKIQAEWYGKNGRTNKLQQLHNYEASENITEQPHAERWRSDRYFQNVDRKHDRNRLRKNFSGNPSVPFMKACILDQNNAHQRQRNGNIHVLRWWCKTKCACDIGYSDVNYG